MDWPIVSAYMWAEEPPRYPPHIFLKIQAVASRADPKDVPNIIREPVRAHCLLSVETQFGTMIKSTKVVLWSMMTRRGSAHRSISILGRPRHLSSIERARKIAARSIDRSKGHRTCLLVNKLDVRVISMVHNTTLCVLYRQMLHCQQTDRDLVTPAMIVLRNFFKGRLPSIMIKQRLQETSF
jgi:hypothetical protein